MPRGTREQANTRPDTQIGGRQVFTQGGVTPERAGRSQGAQRADALASAFNIAGSGIEAYGRQQREADAKEQRLQAFKDFHADSANAVSQDEAEKREAFGDETYRSTYMRLTYSQQAKDLSGDIQQHAQDMMNDPEVGINEVEAYIDATTSGAIQGIDDPEAVDVYANRLSSDAEELKAKARGVAVERQQVAGRTRLNAFIDDVVSEGLGDMPEALANIESQAHALNVGRTQAHKALTDALIRKAQDETDPSILAPLFREREDGTALADEPDIQDVAERARDQIEAEAEERTSAAELTQRVRLRQKQEAGSLTMADIRQVNRDHPDRYTAGQLASMYVQSQATARAAAQKRREASQMMRAGGSAVAMRMKSHGDQQEIFGHIRQSVFNAHENTPEGRQQAFMDYATRVSELSGGVSGVKDDWLAAQLNAQAGATSPDGAMPERFQQGYARYRALKSDPQTRGLLDNMLEPEARRMYQRVEHYADSGDFIGNEDGSHDLTPAFAKAKHDLDNPIDEKTFYDSQSFRQLESAVGDVTDIGAWLGEDYGGDTNTVSNSLEVKQDIRRMAEREMRYSRASLDKALQTAKERYKATHTLVRGTYMKGNYGPMATEAANAKLEEQLPAIQAHTGGGVEMEDLSLLPDGYGNAAVVVGGSRIAMARSADGSRTPVKFSMAEAGEAYAEKMRPKGTTEDRAGVTEAKPHKPALSGSPAAFAGSLDTAHEERRERIGKALSDTWDAVSKFLTEEREVTTMGGAPGSR